MDRTKIGTQLRERRQAIAEEDPRRSIAWYARQLKCTEQTVMNMETGHSRTPPERVAAYAHLLGLELDVRLLGPEEVAAISSASAAQQDAVRAIVRNLPLVPPEHLKTLSVLVNTWVSERFGRALG